MVLVQFLGVFLVFLIFPIYLIPFLEERFETRLPGDCEDARNHVLIYRNGPAVSSLIEELKQAAVTPVIIEEDEAEARRVQEAGHRVVYGSLEGHIMTRVGLTEARALILNGSDHRNAAIAITARQLGFTGDILALVEIPLHRQPTILAGANAGLHAAACARCGAGRPRQPQGEPERGRSAEAWDTSCKLAKRASRPAVCLPAARSASARSAMRCASRSSGNGSTGV